MDTLPDLETFDLFRPGALAPDLERIETALRRSEKIAVSLAQKFPDNPHFTAHLGTIRRGITLLSDARAAKHANDTHRLDAIAAELAGLFTAQGKADRLAEWGLLPG